MSLHTLAHHLQSTGRNGDSYLVHMTPDEVHGLQALAMAKGGSLTINPHTGLLEANFISDAWKGIRKVAEPLLPTLIGAGLMFIPGMQPWAAAALTGAGTAVATGDLSKGIMAGIGAYGGAGLQQGLGSLGAAGTGATESAASTAAMDAAKQGVFSANPAGVIAGQAAPVTDAARIAAQTAAAEGASAAALSSAAPNVATQALNPNSWQAVQAGMSKAIQPGGLSALNNAMPAYSGQAMAAGMMMQPAGSPPKNTKNPALIRPYEFTRELTPEASEPIKHVWDGPVSSGEIDYFKDTMKPLQPYWAPGPEYKKKNNNIVGTYTPMPGMYNAQEKNATAGSSLNTPMYNALGQQIDPYTGKPIEQYAGQYLFAVGGPVEEMSAQNAVGSNAMYPQSQYQTSMYSNPMMQRPMPTDLIPQGLNSPVDPYTGEQKFASGGISQLGSYSDGGRLLKGPGDGVSDSIPAVIGNRQPARLADGEFVVPARIVSELGNGSTEAGAKRLYAMMDRVQRARRKTVGKGRVAADTNAEKYLPA